MVNVKVKLKIEQRHSVTPTVEMRNYIYAMHYMYFNF